jgi:hypothetical protein
MPSRYERLDVRQAQTISIRERLNKVSVQELASPHQKGQTFSQFFDALPHILAVKDMREVVDAIVLACHQSKPVIVTMGAHVIKVGLSPILIDLMQRGVIAAIATNGAGGIHDAELALFGVTSEDVSAGIASGTFGMVEETGAFLNAAACEAAESDCGLGEVLGKNLLASSAAHADKSVLAQGARLGMPVTIHVALGSDINHIQPTINAAAVGAATYTDFQIFAAAVSYLIGGGVLMNVGSSVIMPTVIEKAIALSRNLGRDVSGFVGVDVDFIRHYRSGWNPVKRAQELGGRGYALTGHHEIMLPLMAAAVIERLS